MILSLYTEDDPGQGMLCMENHPRLVHCCNQEVFMFSFDSHLKVKFCRLIDTCVILNIYQGSIYFLLRLMGISVFRIKVLRKYIFSPSVFSSKNQTLVIVRSVLISRTLRKYIFGVCVFARFGRSQHLLTIHTTSI